MTTIMITRRNRTIAGNSEAFTSFIVNEKMYVKVNNVFKEGDEAAWGLS